MSSIEYPDTGNEWCAALEDDSWWFQHRNRFLLEVMRQYPPDTPLYDVGGGNGVVANALVSAGIPAVVIEPGVAGARRAKERGLETICATLETAGLSPGSLGAMGVFDVLEHIREPVQFLRHARELLRPGSRIYVTVPAYAALWSAEDDYAHHFRRYTSHSLRRSLRGAGFDVEFATYMFSFLPFPIFALRSVPYRLRRARPFTRDGARDDHRGGGRLSRAALQRILDLELRALRHWGSIPFGASVVAIARARPT